MRNGRIVRAEYQPLYIYDGFQCVHAPSPPAGTWNGAWHHVAGTFDGSVLGLYVDGTELGAGTPVDIAIAYRLPDGNDLLIGANHTTACTTGFVARIDEVHLFNRALAGTQIQSLSTAKTSGNCRLKVDIDIKPGDSDNVIHLNSKGVIPVAILSSVGFNATNRYEPATIDLNGAKVKHASGAAKPLCHPENVNGDGLLDLVSQVNTDQFALLRGGGNLPGSARERHYSDHD